MNKQCYIDRHPILIFDIKTKIDTHLGRALYQLDLSDADCEQAMIKLRRQETGQDFQRLALHEIICISGLWFYHSHNHNHNHDDYHQQSFKLFSWTRERYSEYEIIQKFFKIFEKYQHDEPKMITWNGHQFDLPLLMIRGMIHGLSSAYLWDNGEIYNQKRYQNYLNRYHHQHIDLMDRLALFHQKHFIHLDEMAQVLGLAGRDPTIQLEQEIQQQNWQTIQRYCESDILNIWLIYLRWLLLKGQLDRVQHSQFVAMTLDQIQHKQHDDFIQRWQNHPYSSLKNPLLMIED